MVSITFTVDETTKSDMDRFSWINWSELAREIFLKKIQKEETLEKLDKIMKNSQLTDKDIDELSRKSKQTRLQQLKARGLI